jgi:hypothetical protein
MQVLDAFIEALNARDPRPLAAACNFPNVRLASGDMKMWRTTKEFIRDSDLAGIPLEREWHHTSLDGRNVVQRSDDKFHVMVTFTRRMANGAPISTFDSLYVVTKYRGHWGIQIRSSFAP